jgi:hypothetical protein
MVLTDDTFRNYFLVHPFSTFSPTYHPTPHGEPFVLKGTVWYVRIIHRAIYLVECGMDIGVLKLCD